MRIPPELLVDGCVRTLQENVLPALDSRFARGQLYAVLDVLRNLRDRVEERRAFAEAVAARAAGAPPDPPEARRDALNGALVAALATIAVLPEAEGAAAHAALGGHLAAQALRDLATLKPSLLEEISRG